MQSFYAKNEEASRFERLWSFQIHSNLVWKLSHLFWFRINHNVSSSRAPAMGGKTTTSFKPPEPMQNTCLTNYSSVLVWTAKGFQIWVRTLGGSQQPFSCVLSHFRHGDLQHITEQLGDPRGSLLLTSEKVVFCKIMEWVKICGGVFWRQ